MSALDRPTADELRRGEIAAAVKNGRITPQEAEAKLHALDSAASISRRSAGRLSQASCRLWFGRPCNMVPT